MQIVVIAIVMLALNQIYLITKLRELSLELDVMMGFVYELFDMDDWDDYVEEEDI